MTRKITNLLGIIAICALSSCAPKLVGTWTVHQYQATSPGANNVMLNNVGTINFAKDGTGSQQLNYSLLGIEKNNSTTFKWSWKEGDYVLMKNDSTQAAKIWIISAGSSKTQELKSTDGQSTIQTLKLTKQEDKA